MSEAAEHELVSYARRHGMRDIVAASMHDLFGIDVESGEMTQAHDHARAAFRAYGPRNPRLPRLAHDLAYFWMMHGRFEAALDGDGIAREVLATIGRRLGVALSSLANIFEPGVIVIGGGVSAAGDLLLDPARAEVETRSLPPMNRTPVVAAELGPDAGMIGAAVMAIEEMQAEEEAQWLDA